MRQYITSLTTATLIIPTIILLTGADHAEAPDTISDPAADIADVYVWHDTAANTLTMACTFSGLQSPSTTQGGNYSDDVLYTFHIDRTGNAVSDIDIDVRFGHTDSMSAGVQVRNMPGAGGTISGAVETVLSGSNSSKVFAGLRDDPFFFDLDGFHDTLATASLQFDSSRDSFAGTNVTAIVLEMPLTTVTDSGAHTALKVWVTTARKGMTAPTAVSMR